MNEKDVQKSENIASKILRALAILGLVAVLAFVAWLVVQGIRLAPNAGNGVGTVFSSITSFFTGDSDESKDEQVRFDLETRTLTHGVPATISWQYVGENMPTEYVFTYNCHRDVVFILQGAVGAQEIACDTKFFVASNSFSIIPRSLESRFADVEITIASGDSKDTSLITIVNSGALLADSDNETIVDVTTTDTTNDTVRSPASREAETTPVASAVDTETPVVPVSPVVEPQAEGNVEHRATPDAHTPAVVHTIVPRTPADLVVAIKETGVYLDVAGEMTFFPISPIPTDKRAGVVFTVTNNGGEPTGAWAFVASLPVEGDETYRYTSPAQSSLLPNAQVEFTLGFDRVLEEDEGTIRLEVVPTKESDRTGNNVDAIVVELR